MKKNHFHRAPWRKGVLKTMLLMKLTFAIILAACLQVSANSYSQEKVTVDFRNTPLEKALKEIEKKSSYRFVYSTLKIPKNTRVTVQGVEIPVKELLTQLLGNTGLTYQLMDEKLIVIAEADAETAYAAVTGKVVNEKGEPLAGVTVQVKGDNTAVTTAADGSFSINTNQKDVVLIFSYVGTETQEIAVKGRSSLQVKMLSSDKPLDDVIVIGYGSKTKTTVTGAVSTVSAAQLANRPSPNVATSLQGLVPGLVVTRGNAGRVGREGDNLFLRLRGVTSRSGDAILFVVDGVPQTNGGAFSLNNINPDDIESINVLKDGQAAIYGSRAGGGVVLITTKSGRSEKPVVSINSNISINTPGIYRKQANILQAIDMWTESYENDGVVNNYYSHLKPFLTQNLDLNKITVAKGPFPDTKDITLSNNDWMKIMWGNATTQQHTLSVSGRNGRSSYWVSMGVLDQQSMLQYGTNYNRKYNTRLKYDFDVNSWLKIKTNISLQTQKLVEPTDYDNIENITAFSFAGKAKYTQSGKYYGFGGYLSTIGWAQEGGNRESRNTQLRTQFEALLTPVKNLEITGRLAINKDNFDEFALRTGFLSYTYDDEVIFNSNLYWGGKDQVSAAYSKNNQTLTELFANYKYELKSHHFNLLGGVSHEEFESRNLTAYRNGNPGLINNQLSWLGNGALTEQFNDESRSDWAFNSAFSRLSYDFDQRYLVEGIYRLDASSRFAPGLKGKSFFSVSGGWVLTNEKFAEKIKNTVDFAKIRLSYGELGNQSGVGLYDYVQFIGFGAQYPFGPVGAPLRTPTTYIPALASPDRTWEKIATTNAGLDLRFFSNRLSTSVDYYIRKVNNLFYQKEFPSILGVVAPQINGGVIETKGWDLSIGWKDKAGKNLQYFVNVVLGDSKSKVISLADSRIPGFGLNQYTEGYSPFSYFGYSYDGLIQTDGDLTKYKSAISGGIPTNIRTGDVKFKDLNGDGKLTPILYNPKDPSKGGDLTYLGHANPRYNYSVNLGANWKGFYFSAIFQGVGQWLVTDNNVAAVEFFRNPLAYHYGNTWKTTNQGALYPKTSQDGGIYGYNYQLSNAPFKLRSAAYMRFKNLQIGYNLPQSLIKRAKLKSVQVYFSGNDIAEWSKVPVGFDPEKPFSIVNTPYPRTYSFGLNLSL